MTQFVKQVGDLLDKLTDVLNFGRILSIGVPGFIVSFSLLMLLSLFSAPMPTRWAVTSGATADTLGIEPSPVDVAMPTEARKAVEARRAEATGAIEARKAGAARSIEAMKVVEAMMAAESVQASGTVKATIAESTLETVKRLEATRTLLAVQAAEALMAAETVKAAEALNTANADTAGKPKIVVLSYYEQEQDTLHHRFNLLSFIDRSRVQFDAERVVKRWDYWILWLIGAILVGSLVSQWGYWVLRKQELLYGIWTRMVRLTGGPVSTDVRLNARAAPEVWAQLEGLLTKHDVPQEDRKVLEEAWTRLIRPNWRLSVLRELCGRAPWTREKLCSALDSLGEAKMGSGRTMSDEEPYKQLRVGLELARCGSDEPSWTMLHLPLLNQNMGASQSITYLDHLTKEYWRFAEFAVNCPAAVSLFCLFLGLYFLLLSAMYGGGAWLVGLVLVAAGIGVFMAALLWWNPNVAFTSFNNYKIARSGLIAGLSLFPPDKDSNITIPDQIKSTMYIQCGEFLNWYRRHCQGSLVFEPPAPDGNHAGREALKNPADDAKRTETEAKSNATAKAGNEAPAGVAPTLEVAGKSPQPEVPAASVSTGTVALTDAAKAGAEATATGDAGGAQPSTGSSTA
jgi:hypothetical protein